MKSNTISHKKKYPQETGNENNECSVVKASTSSLLSTKWLNKRKSVMPINNTPKFEKT